MTNPLIHDRGRGPEITGTRTTVYTLLPHFLDPDATEASIARLYDLNAEPVAAARAYVLNNPDVVLGGFLEIEARSATAVNPPEVIERAEETRATLLRFKEWLAQRDIAEATEVEPSTGNGHPVPEGFPTF